MGRLPSAAVRHGKARQRPGTGPCAECRRVLWALGPRGQYSGKVRFIEKPGYKARGIAMWLNVVLTPVSLPRSQSSGTGSSAICAHCCPLCPTGVCNGEIRFIGSQGEMGPGDLCRVPSAAVRHGKTRQRSGTGPCAEGRRVLFGKCSFYREIRGTRLGGRNVAKRIGGNSFYRAPGGGKWAHETCAGCPQQWYVTGEPGKAQGRDRVGIVEGSSGDQAHGVSIRGNFVLSRIPGYKTIRSPCG